MGHGHFMIRLKEWLVWKPQEGFGEFQVLVASGHDRVFGEMVKAQRAEMKKKEEEEYRKRKIAEREARAKQGDGDKDKDGSKDKDKEEGDKNKKEKEKEVAGIKSKVSPGGTPGTELEEAKVMVALPVKDLKDLKEVKDPKNAEAEKHEQEPHIVGPDVQVAAEAPGALPHKADGEKEAMKVAEKLMDEVKGDLKMGDIKAAFKALEDAAGGTYIHPLILSPVSLNMTYGI